MKEHVRWDEGGPGDCRGEVDDPDYSQGIQFSNFHRFIRR
jgi:hypothetical protein